MCVLNIHEKYHANQLLTDCLKYEVCIFLHTIYENTLLDDCLFQPSIIRIVLGNHIEANTKTNSITGYYRLE